MPAARSDWKVSSARRVEQDARGSAQAGRGGGGALGAGAAGQALEAFLAQDVPDRAQAGGGGLFGVEAGLDVGHRQVRLAQFDHALAHVRQRQDGSAPGGLRWSEEERGRIVKAAEVAGHRIDRTDGIAEAPGDGLGGEALEEEGTQDFVPPLERVGRLGKECGVGLGGHLPDLGYHIVSEITIASPLNTNRVPGHQRRKHAGSGTCSHFMSRCRLRGHVLVPTGMSPER